MRTLFTRRRFRSARRLFAAAMFVSLVASPLAVRADSFGSGANTFDIDFLTIGNPGNAADTDDGDEDQPGIQNFGSVSQEYRIGKYDISEQMIDKANVLGGLGIIKTNTRGPDKPATLWGWGETARFVNWLNTSTGSPPAYKFDFQPGEAGYSPYDDNQLWTINDAGYNPLNLYRNSLAKYFLPSVDEWYKAAYYDPTSSVYYNYSTGSNSVPMPVASGTADGTAVYWQPFAAGPADITLAGGLSPYGTAGQGGNVSEREETEYDLVNDGNFPDSGIHGSCWWCSDMGPISSHRERDDPSLFDVTGFRVASLAIPEPSTILLFGIGSLIALGTRKGR